MAQKNDVSARGGGEPQRNPQVCTLARMLHDLGIRVTLLTAGTLLSTEAEILVTVIDDPSFLSMVRSGAQSNL
jgi:MoaA/NifB/PqqE/SkfB family radical SAM enzyme